MGWFMDTMQVFPLLLRYRMGHLRADAVKLGWGLGYTEVITLVRGSVWNQSEALFGMHSLEDATSELSPPFCAVPHVTTEPSYFRAAKAKSFAKIR